MKAFVRAMVLEAFVLSCLSNNWFGTAALPYIIREEIVASQIDAMSAENSSIKDHIEKITQTIKFI